MTTTTDVNRTMNSFFRMTIHKLAFVFAAAAFSVSTPCFAAKFSKPQVAAIVAIIQAGDAAANSGFGAPAAAATSEFAFAIEQYCTAINTMVDDLKLPLPQSSLIKDLVVQINGIAENAAGAGQVPGFQLIANAVTQLGNTINQLQGVLTPSLGTNNPNVAVLIPVFTAAANAGDTRIMAPNLSRLGDLLFVFLNELQ